MAEPLEFRIILTEEDASTGGRPRGGDGASATDGGSSSMVRDVLSRRASLDFDEQQARQKYIDSQKDYAKVLQEEAKAIAQEEKEARRIADEEERRHEVEDAAARKRYTQAQDQYAKVLEKEATEVAQSIIAREKLVEASRLLNLQGPATALDPEKSEKKEDKAKKQKEEKEDTKAGFADLLTGLREQFLPNSINAIVDKLGDAFGYAKQAFASASGGAGQAAATAATGAEAAEAEEGLAAAAGGAEEALALIPGVGLAVAAALAAASIAAYAFSEAVSYFVNRGKELSAYSPELAQSGATAEVRGILADIRESQELGPELARLTDAQTDFNQELREALLPIKKFIIEVLADVMEWLVDAIREIRIGIAILGTISEEGFKAMVAALTLHLPTAVEILNGISGKVEEAVRALQKPPEEGNVLDTTVRNMFESIRRFRPQAVPDPVRRAAQQGLNVPLFS